MNNTTFGQGGFGQPQPGFGQPQASQFGQPQASQFGQPQAAPAAGATSNIDAIFGFEKSYEDIAAGAESRIDLEPGIVIWPIQSVTLYNSKSGNAGVRLNFSSGQLKSNGDMLTLENTFYILDKKNDYRSFDSRQVEKMRSAIFRTFGYQTPDYWPPITSLYDTHVVGALVDKLHSLLADKQAALELNWPDDTNDNGDAYIEIRYMNPVKDLEYLQKKFTPKPKPTGGAGAGASRLPAAPVMPGMPTQNPTAMSSPGHAPLPQMAQPQPQFAAPQFQQPQAAPAAPQFQAPPQAAASPYGAPPQPQAPVFQAPQAVVQAPPQAAAPQAAAPHIPVISPAPAPAGWDPAQIPHLSLHPAWAEGGPASGVPMVWNAQLQAYQFSDGQNGFSDTPF
jgi:hypothetical protein